MRRQKITSSHCGFLQNSHWPATRVWIDRNRLRGGHDFWDEIERVLRKEVVKQIVIFTANVRKSGVKKELALGEVMKAKLGDANFMIGIRNDASDFNDAPPELLAGKHPQRFPQTGTTASRIFLTRLINMACRETTGPDAGLLSP